MSLSPAAGQRRIFLSHSRYDHWICHVIGEKIRAAGCEVWIDAFDVDVGRNIAEAIKAGLRNSTELLILLSPASIQSDWVKHEAGIADALDLPIVLVLLHVTLDDRPEPLKDRRAISINELPDYFAALGSPNPDP